MNFVWYVVVRGLDAEWPIGFYDSEKKAQDACDAYEINRKELETSKRVVRAEVK